jgi:hypothetical protein
MWFLFVEIFVLVAISFFIGAGLTHVALRIFLKTTDKPTPDEQGVTA